jgi:hypothetical protein
VQQTRQVMEIFLEELGERSWLAALANTLGGSYGSALFRFAGRVAAAEDDRDDVVGATFPMMRLQSLDDVAEPNAWSELARAGLEDLDATLRSAGWHPEEPRGPHWWSLRYSRG